MTASPTQVSPTNDPAPAIPLLALEGITKGYEQSSPLFTDLTLEIFPTQSVAIMGPSGSGKSTLLHIMGGLVSPDGGRVLIRGVECGSQAQWDEVRMRTLGHIFQDAWLLPSLTAAENIEIPMIGMERSARARRDRVAWLLEMTSMSDRANARAAILSGGERQRVAFARAIANRPKIILADEPTGNLDSRNKGFVVELLHDLCDREGAALVLATHDVNVADTCRTKLMLSQADVRLQ